MTSQRHWSELDKFQLYRKVLVMIRESRKDSSYQLSMLIQDYEHFTKEKRMYPSRNYNGTVEELMIQSLAALDRIVPSNSVYRQRTRGIISSEYYEDHDLEMVMGTIRALYKDIDRGFIHKTATLIRGEIFDDFLENASLLLESGYKDAAAVIAGSSLESHLRQLCLNRDMDTERQANSGTRFINADTLNSNLARDGVYSKLDQKNVTAWLGLRNNAAHGHYDEYTDQQVALMIDSVRDFITRNPQ